jgi:hypothetical protein
MGDNARRIEELREYVAEKGVDLSVLHIWGPAQWIVSAAQLLGLDPGLALATDLDWGHVLRLS